MISAYLKEKKMKAVIQRVLDATLKVDGELISQISNGFVIFLGVGKGDGKEQADYMIKKIPPLRICEDENGKINKSIIDQKCEILLVSQFTLFADTSHGNRPSFFEAEIGTTGTPKAFSRLFTSMLPPEF